MVLVSVVVGWCFLLLVDGVRTEGRKKGRIRESTIESIVSRGLSE